MNDIRAESPILEKIDRARSYFFARGEEFRADPETASLLARLGCAIASAGEEMARAGITSMCRNCEENEHGSCCGSGIENRYDSVAILINLLLDCDLSGTGRIPGSCFFLGDHGCLLRSRHVICVNYICEKISCAAVPEKLAALREKEGVELETAFLLHSRIKSLLKGR